MPITSAGLELTIRAATAEDLPLCAALRAIYTTDTAWQLLPDNDRRWKRDMTGAPGLSFLLQQVRLPRQRALMLPSSTVPLSDVWESYSARLIAENDTHVCGYLLLRVLPEQQQSMIARLLVDVSMRRKGVGRVLVRAARSWAMAHDQVALTAHAPLRNVPGITFYQRCGFHISGVIEHFYPTREDGLLLSQGL